GVYGMSRHAVSQARQRPAYSTGESMDPASGLPAAGVGLGSGAALGSGVGIGSGAATGSVSAPGSAVASSPLSASPSLGAGAASGGLAEVPASGWAAGGGT